jgi:hypothetical protein
MLESTILCPQQNINDPIVLKIVGNQSSLSAFNFKRPLLKVYGILCTERFKILFFGAIILKCPALVS